MARIRIVDEWLRSPVSQPSRQRAIMVVARQWAEQRVLMRAFASCDDQTRPTIVLHGSRLSIGPAGTDPTAEWGIHVEPPVDGRAQELRVALELAARLLAGSKGNPPRLEDEIPLSEDLPTGNWAPKSTLEKDRPANYYEPTERVVQPATIQAKLRKTPPAWGHNYDRLPLARGSTPSSRFKGGKTMIGFAAAQEVTRKETRVYPRPEVSPTSLGPGPARSRKRHAAKTMHGFSSAQKNRDNYAVLANKTLPMGFHLETAERALLNALGESPTLSASEVGALLQVADPMRWMAELMDKLADFGLDLVAPGEDRNGEPTYVLVY